MNNHDTAAPGDSSGSTVERAASFSDGAQGHGRYDVRCFGPRENLRPEYLRLRQRLEDMERRGGVENLAARFLLRRRMESMLEEKWADHIDNLWTTVGKNDCLDKYLAGSAYTATWYIGLISSTTYGAGLVVGDTQASHAGWLEAGAANAPTYSQATRPAAAFSAASAGSKSTSAASVFSITGTGTAKGMFLASVNTKDGTTGILFGGGLFTQGDRAVVNGDTLNVSYTATLT